MHDEPGCAVLKAYHAWQDVVSVQEEHSDSMVLSFHETQERIGWDEHQDCIIPILDNCANMCMEAETPAEAYVLVRSALMQMSLICFILGRQHEGAEL